MWDLPRQGLVLILARWDSELPPQPRNSDWMFTLRIDLPESLQLHICTSRLLFPPFSSMCSWDISDRWPSFLAESPFIATVGKEESGSQYYGNCRIGEACKVCSTFERLLGSQTEWPSSLLQFIKSLESLSKESWMIPSFNHRLFGVSLRPR